MIQTEPSSPVPCAHFPRRPFQYPLLTLFIITAIIAVWLGWWSHKARQQRGAVAALAKAGADVRYDFELEAFGSIAPYVGQPREPRWMVDAIGIDYFAEVAGVSANGSQITDADLKQLQGMTGLRFLNLGNTNITDAGLGNLKNLTALQWLDLRDTKVTDAGVARLQKSLPNCRIER